MTKQLTPMPKDSIQCIACCKQLVAIAAWDNSVHVYNLVNFQQQFQAQLPAIALCIQMDESYIYVGCSDSIIYKLNISSPSPEKMYKFGGPVRTLHIWKNLLVLTTLSCEVALFNPKTSQVVHTQTLTNRAFCSSIFKDKILICTASRQVIQGTILSDKISLQPPTESPLRHQTRQCLIISDTQYALSSVEGRVAVEGADAFAFRAHKVQSGDEVISYPVNSLMMHKSYLVTAGGDGFVYFWDLKQRKKVYKIQESYAVQAVAVSGDSMMVAKSYGWEGRAAGQKGEAVELLVYNVREFGL